MGIHPYTNQDIARQRGEERLLRAQAAQRANQVREQRQEDRGPVQVPGATIRLLQRIGVRKVATSLPHAGDGV